MSNFSGAVLIVLSILAILVGMFSLSDATFGVGFIAIGAIMSVFARMAQSQVQHAEIMKELGKAEDEDEVSTDTPE